MWQRVRDRLERNGLLPDGRVRVQLDTREGRHAAGALLGRTVTSQSVVIDLAALDARLRERAAPGGLVEVITALSGPMSDRPAARDAKIARRERPLELARSLVDRPWADAWVAELRRTGLLTRSVESLKVVREAAATLDAVLDRPRTDLGWSRVELAADVLGDSHALDGDRLLHRVVLRALAAAAEMPVPTSPDDRWALWEAFGVAPDLVSSGCLVLGLAGEGGGSAASRLDAATRAGDPMHLTRWDLRRLDRLRGASGPVLVCENPRVLEAVAERYAGRHAVVCTAGEPTRLVAAVLEMLYDADCTLRYHGDFDWPGIAITNRLVDRFDVVPWLMGVADYERAVRADAPPLDGTPVEAAWDPELGPAMRSAGRVLHEETMLAAILDALPAMTADPP